MAIDLRRRRDRRNVWQKVGLVRPNRRTGARDPNGVNLVDATKPARAIPATRRHAARGLFDARKTESRGRRKRRARFVSRTMSPNRDVQVPHANLRLDKNGRRDLANLVRPRP